MAKEQDRGRGRIEMGEDREKSRRQREEEFRKRRVPIGGMRQKLSAPKIEGYHCRWFNDKGSRLEDAVNAGYQFVNHEFTPIGVGEGLDGNTDLGTLVSRPTDWENGTRSYYMAIRKDWFEEDKRAKQEERRPKKEAVRKGKYQLGAEPSKMYVPSSGIRVNQKTVRG